MANALRGELSVKINNASVPALINMNAFRLLSDRFQITLAGIDEHLNDDPLNTIPKIVFCGMVNHCQRTGTPEGSLPTFEQICAFVCEDETSFTQITNDVLATLAPDPASEGNAVAVPK